MSGAPSAAPSSSGGAGGSAGVARAKARTSSSIPQMRATGVLREAPPSAVANANAPRSDRLEEEAKRMEERLRQLKVAMTTEKQKRDAITKTKAGTFWKGANPVSGDKSYMEDVMARVEKRIAKSNALAGSQSTRTPATGTGAAGTGAQRPSAQRSVSAVGAGKAGATGVTAGDAAGGTPVKSSYVPPIKPKSDISAPSAIRPQGTADQSASARSAAGGGVSARSSTSASNAAAAASAASSSPAPSAAASAPTPSSAAAASASPAFVNPADDETRSSAPGSLLDGDFDEAQNKRAFEEARQQWIAETTGGGDGDGAGTARSARTKVQLVHDPDYSPAELASNTGVSASSSLLSGPAFDERESAKEFAEARRAWMQSLAEEGGATAAPKLQPAQSRANASANADGMWDPSAAVAGGASILFPSESDSAPAAPGTVVSAALRNAQSELERSAKHSCYNCYKLFYSASAFVEPDFPGRPFCSSECAAATAASTKIRCGGDGCPRSVLRSQGQRVEGKFMCRSCADNGGRAVRAAMEEEEQQMHAAAGAAPPSVHSSCDSIPPASSSPEPDAEGDGDAHTEESDLDSSFSASNAQGAIPEAASPAIFAMGRRLGGASSRPASAAMGAAATTAAARFDELRQAADVSAAIASSAALSRPTSAAVRLPVDTSVIRVAPAGSGPPVVEFPDSDED